MLDKTLNEFEFEMGNLSLLLRKIFCLEYIRKHKVWPPINLLVPINTTVDLNFQ